MRSNVSAIIQKIRRAVRLQWLLEKREGVDEVVLRREDTFAFRKPENQASTGHS